MKHKKIQEDLLETSLKYLREPRCLEMTRTLVFFFCLFAIFWAAPAAYGGSQARGQMRAVAASLHHSHNMGSELCLQPTPQLTTTPDP